MTEKKSQEAYIKVTKTSKIKKGEGISVKVGEKRFAIFNVDGQFFATDDACPHRGAPLGDGPLEGTVVTCTWHGWEFDIKKGCHVVDPDVRLNRYPVKEKNGQIYIQMEPIKNDAQS